MTLTDEDYMAQALAMARRGLGTTWPNPSVGCVIVTPEGEIVGRGVTAPGGRPHAEAIALAQAGERAMGATVYVTLEPCAHEGRGEACASALAAASPARVVCAIRDPDPRTSGKGIEELRAAGIAVDEGVLAEEATEITRGHILRVAENRPEVILKLAVGSDGRIPEGNGSPVWVTGEAARAHAHLQRARCDAILIGRGTVTTDDPSLTCRLPGLECRSPVRVILDRRLRTPKKAQLFDDEMVPVWFVCADEPQTNESALQERGAEIIRVNCDEEGYPCVREALEGLALAGITRVLVEGGPAVAKSFLDADLVDEAIIYQGAEEVGEEGLLPFVDEGIDKLTGNGAFIPTHTRSFGRDTMTEWKRNRPCSPDSSKT
ncbi:bifunctional diaminohydroxyphosphoribosylaminopyrimidine deaminase/5-amino-6-(5-phosphoribosylamino)uracil reductase RibD [Methyloligella sp. 2.7D]|uniref:bifunctional diaminohydroxyphosphoribosylaminopyrimidine deaminase/5-amino-6-(5-phosphoribosylamino)uracil reductase RibD n=1 Tax=unclassified Methyloligella TaxID=2625955 RepID=UPI00157D2CAE|nr:bifunctional diaminohydroxyphosphoribosylaminopyrimidine deaminase/5-amino-6-(5-phosphoribosylamino)uracil reductase RibD [Methyloligella sp. GL2]QKP77597.1 bifunctional diaminohydroxyphosphoribosylaminopyrimidine deaminase/5-amino-6-(5-phosphoribosylamino)uracil reductase RibD [Methyloligella sp. GL2]